MRVLEAEAAHKRSKRLPRALNQLRKKLPLLLLSSNLNNNLKQLKAAEVIAKRRERETEIRIKSENESERFLNNQLMDIKCEK